MSQWDIDVYGVSLFLSDISYQLGVDGGGFMSTIDSTSDGVDMALSNVKSPPVESALSDFLGHFTTETDAMFTRTLSCLQGSTKPPWPTTRVRKRWRPRPNGRQAPQKTST